MCLSLYQERSFLDAAEYGHLNVIKSAIENGSVHVNAALVRHIIHIVIV